MEAIKNNKYIAFSVWGDTPLYTQGAVRNAEIAPEIYPGWQVVVYHDQTVPRSVLDALASLNVRLIDMSTS